MPEKSTDYNRALVDGNFTTPKIHQTIYVLSSFLRLETGRYLHFFFWYSTVNFSRCCTLLIIRFSQLQITRFPVSTWSWQNRHRFFLRWYLCVQRRWEGSLVALSLVYLVQKFILIFCCRVSETPLLVHVLLRSSCKTMIFVLFSLKTDIFPHLVCRYYTEGFRTVENILASFSGQWVSDFVFRFSLMTWHAHKSDHICCHWWEQSYSPRLYFWLYSDNYRKIQPC